jgi:hypothetical protein
LAFFLTTGTATLLATLYSTKTSNKQATSHDLIENFTPVRDFTQDLHVTSKQYEIAVNQRAIQQAISKLKQ